MRQRLAEKEESRKIPFCFWLGEIIACSHANEKNPAEREEMITIGE